MNVCRVRVLVSAALACAALTQPAEGQEVVFRGGNRGLSLADEVIRAVLERGRYRIITRDTMVAEGSTISRDVIVLGASVRLAGTIRGDLIAVESDIFTRPGARVQGLVVVLNGGFYGSALADLAVPPIDGSLYAYRVERPRAGRYLIVAPGGRASFRTPGLKGFLLPSYDRVNALTLSWGFAVERGRASPLPSLEARVRGRSARGKLDGEVRLDWPFGRNGIFVVSGRTVRTRDEWILGDIGNMITSLVLGSDYRNYYDAKFATAGIRLAHGQAVRWSHRLGFEFEASRSLDNQDPFSIFEYRGDFRPNPEVDEGDIGSLSLVSELEAWPRPLSELRLVLEAEGASSDAVGDFTYLLISVGVHATLPTGETQRLALNARAQGLGGADSPRQRWRALGGERTLPVLKPLERRGDQLWWAELVYLVETGMRLGPFGPLEAWASYSSGSAWLRGEPEPEAVHNLGLGVNLGPVSVGAYTDPGDEFDSVLAVGIGR